MNNEMTLNVREMKNQLVMNQIMAAALRPLQAIANYYSRMLEQPVSVRQTLHLINAQLAFVMTVFVDSPILFRVFCAAWLVVALLRCKNVLGK